MLESPTPVILVILLGLSLSSPEKLQAADLLVPSQFSTIQAAIEAAQTSDQILVGMTVAVCGGTYIVVSLVANEVRTAQWQARY
ncbi:MAG TPA: hypothetical protein EYO84_07795, partial [Planctomycetes bacterium]|nr:hypothetical protein [Planctomycetota bacterium]